MKAHVVIEENGALTLITPYSPGFVTDIKTEIPAWYRSYDPDAKIWKVEAEYADQAHQLLDQHFEQVRRVYPSAGARTSATPQSAPCTRCASGDPSRHASVARCVETVRQLYPSHSLLHILPAAPEPVVLAAYRALSKLLHPDISGRDSTAEMRAVNAAYASLKTGA